MERGRRPVGANRGGSLGVGGEEGESATKLLFDLRSAVIIKFLL